MDFRRPPPDPTPENGSERDRILGVETEHAVIYVPHREEEQREEPGWITPGPPFELLQSVLFECLLADRKSAVSGGLKGGYFLENGGLIHLELFFRRQDDTPILEVATPECRSPWDVLNYSRAFDAILDETSRSSEAALASQDTAGRIAFGKNNLDVHGTGFGCHENYLVYSCPTRLQRALYLLFVPLVLCCLIPAIALVLLIIIVPLVAIAFALIVARIVPAMQTRLVDSYRWFVRENPWRLATVLRSTWWVLTNAVLFPAVTVYSKILQHLAYRPIVQDLASFLVSRQILCGSGSLNFARGVYELSQRAELTRSIGEIVLFGQRKTFFDLKGFLYSPLEFFRQRKKLTITVGDSNLSDVPNLLKLGTTALLLEMIEDGESFSDLRLRRPIRALKRVSREGPWKQVQLRSGKKITAIELQREFLVRAKAYHLKRPSGRLERHRILELWEENLTLLADGRQSLTTKLDWVAKKALFDQAIAGKTHWKAIFAWGRLFVLAGIPIAAKATSFENFLCRVGPLQRARLRWLASKSSIDPGEFGLFRQLYFQLRKIDFRYHELGDGQGYQRTLEREGLIERLSDDEAVERAQTEAPADTRARIRSYYIRLSRERQLLRVNWNEIELLSPMRHIPTPDPFYHRLPTD
jgi:hypothetical protein